MDELDDPDYGVDLEIPLFFGRYLVRQGLLSDDELAAALAVQSDLNDCLACALLEERAISQDDLIRCRRYQRVHAVTFETALRRLNLLDQAQLDALRRTAQQRRVQLGTVLVTQSRLTQDQLQQHLAAFAEDRFI